MSVLIMTGTIQPKQGARELARTDVPSRVADYRVSVAHHLSLVQQGVLSGLVFVENSGYGMEPFTDMLTDDLAERAELISYDAQQAPQEPRFWGECKLLKEAFRRSRVINSSTDTHVWKVTGRYIVRNLSAILRRSEEDNDLMLHCRNHPMRYVDFGLAGFSREKAEQIMDRVLQRQNDEDIDERMLRTMVDDGSFADLRLRQRLSHVPDFRGVRGSDNRSYGGFRYRVKFLLRSLVHHTMPAVWI